MPEKVLFLSAKNLENKDGMFGKSDPYAVVTMVVGDEDPEEIGETEVVKNNLSPVWFKSFVFYYEEGEDYAIHVKLFDKDKDGDDSPMGGTFFDIDSIIDSEDGSMTKKLRGGGELTVTIEDVSEIGILQLQLQGRGLKNVEGLFKKSDPFYRICKLTNEDDEDADGDNWAPMYQSNYVKNNLDPLWNAMKCDLNVLCNDDTEAPIKIFVYDYESSGDHKLIGSVETTVEELISSMKFGESGSAVDDDADHFLALEDKSGEDAGSIAVIRCHIKEIEEEDDESE